MAEDQKLRWRTCLLQQPDVFSNRRELGRRQALPADKGVVFRVADNLLIG